MPDLIIFEEFNTQFVHEFQFSSEIGRELKERFITILPDRTAEMSYVSLQLDNVGQKVPSRIMSQVNSVHGFLSAIPPGLIGVLQPQVGLVI